MKTINDIIAEVWPGWRLESIIGAGTYGEVYRAVREDAAGISTAAIKVMKTHLLANRTACADQAESKAMLDDVISRFSREIQVMQSLKGQSHLISIDDYQIREDAESGIWYFLIRMELLTPLLVDLDIRNYDEDTLIRMGIDICCGLEICESQHIIHRDIKPENIFVNPLGEFKLGDFGVARTMDMTRESLTNWEFAQWERFTAPEIKNGQMREACFEEAHRADIYSLGMVMYWIANGRTFPFLRKKQMYNSQDRNEAESRRLKGEALPPLENISPGLEHIICKACAFRNEDRYENAEQFRKALEGIRASGERSTQIPGISSHQGSKIRRRWLLPVAVLCAIAVIAGGWMLLKSRHTEKDPEPAVQETAIPIDDITVNTLTIYEAEYPHVYNIGQPMTLGGYVASDVELADITLRLYTDEETYTQHMQLAPGAKRFDMRDAGDELYRNLKEGRFWIELIASDTAGRTVGFSHTSTASLTANDHTLYPINRSCRPPELKGTFTYAGHTYEVYYLAGGGWDTSNAFAQGKGGHLVTFTDEEEFNMVTSFVLGMGCKWLNIGAQYRDGIWSWMDDTPFEFHPWNPNIGEEGTVPYDPYGSVVYTKKQWYFGKATQYEMNFFIMEYDEVLR